MNVYHWVSITKKNIVTSDSNYNYFFVVVVTGPFLKCEFDSRMKAACLQEKFFYFVSVCVPHWTDVIDKSFQENGCCVALLLCLSISRSILAMKILANATAIFVPIAVPRDWRKSFPLTWNEFSCRIRPSIFLKYLVSIGGIRLIKLFVCFANSVYTFLLWYVSIETSDIHWDKGGIRSQSCLLYKVD